MKKFFSLFLAFTLVMSASLLSSAGIVSAVGTETAVSTLSELRAALESNAEKTVIINNDIAVNSGYIIEIPQGAKITLKSNEATTITASGSNFNYGAILVKSGAELTIEGNIIFKSTAGYFLDIAGTVTMNSGNFSNCKGQDGGAIQIRQYGSFTMNGGSVSNSTGVYGGAVHIKNGGKFTMNGGTITNNTASSAGGAIYANGEFIMNGGAISGNTAADQGGGIYIDTKGKITLNAGDFFNNAATARYGGAIGTGTSPQSAANKIYNAVIVGNNANTGDGRGGGIWSCPSGIVSFQEGSVIFAGNSASNRGAQLCIESSAKPFIPTKMLGGSDYSWYWDMVNKRYPGLATAFTNGVTPPNYDSGGITLTNTELVSAGNLAALKAEFPAGKVFIYNNNAGSGGGVGGNGSVSFVLDETAIPTATPTATPTAAPTATPALIQGTIYIHKGFSAYGLPVAGVQFDYYNYTDDFDMSKLSTYTKLGTTAPTDKYGNSATQLPPGKYVFSERKVPGGFDPIYPSVFTADILSDGTVQQAAKGPMGHCYAGGLRIFTTVDGRETSDIKKCVFICKNTPIVRIAIVKLDKDATVMHYDYADRNDSSNINNPLKGAGYKVWYKDRTGELVPYVTDNLVNPSQHIIYDTDDAVNANNGAHVGVMTDGIYLVPQPKLDGKGNYMYDVNGNIIMDSREYVIRETQFPSGYDSAKPFDFNVTVNADGTYTVTQTAETIANYGILTVEKPTDSKTSWLSSILYARNSKISVPTPTPLNSHELGWMRSSELAEHSFKTPVGGLQWTYEEAFDNTPIKYFENADVQAKANEKAAQGTENARPANEQLVGIQHIWDCGTYFDKYKISNGNVGYDWASWQHFGTNGNTVDKGEYSVRRFAAYFELTADNLKNLNNVFLAPGDELGNMSYLFPVNDNVFVFVNGQLAYWGGTDVVDSGNMHKAANRVTFMGKEGIPVQNGFNEMLKDVYRHTDGWAIDLEKNAADVNIKPYLTAGFNRIDVITDDYWEGGGMNRMKLYFDYFTR